MEASMTREQKYIGQMERLGIYDEIFAPEIHALCIMERDLQRLTKRWKADGYQTVEKNGRGPAATDRTFDAIMTLRRQILATCTCCIEFPWRNQRYWWLQGDNGNRCINVNSN